MQLAARQVTEESGYSQRPIIPLHSPPQTPALLQAARFPCDAPEIGVQIPSLPATSHASQEPSQS